MKDQSFSLTLVEREPRKGRQFSIERVFDAVSSALPPEVTVRRMRVPRRGVRPSTIMRNARAARAVRADVIHVTGDVQYLVPFLRRSAVRVLTVHDLRSLHRTSGLRRMAIRWLWFTLPLRTADVVTTVSGETQRQLVAEFGSLADKAVVIENPLPHPFAGAQPRNPEPEKAGADLVVLAVGTGANKNLPRIAEAVRRLGATLRVVGALDPPARAALDQSGVRYAAVHSLSDAELLETYRAADALAFCSLNEGFGLPIIEAQAVGLPVVTSDRLPMTSVAGGAAVLVDPENVDEIALGLSRALSDQALRTQLRDAGLDNARRYVPGAVAQRYVEAYLRGIASRRAR